MVHLPVADMAAAYRAGASIATVAATFGCSYEGARNALVRAGVELRRPRQPVRTPLALHGRCRGCGEDLDRPHPSGLGAHLPACAYAAQTTGGTADEL